MWPRLVFSGTLLSLLTHSIIGCCWHHAHPEGHQTCEHTSSGPHFGGKSDDRQCHTGHSEPTVSAPCHTLGSDSSLADTHHGGCGNTGPVQPVPCDQDQSCDELRCVYLTTDPVRAACVFDCCERVATPDASGVLMSGNPIAARTSLHHSPGVFVQLQHRALTQVWVI